MKSDKTKIFPLLIPIVFPLAIPLIWPGVLILANYLQAGRPIELDGNQWQCTATETAPVGMVVATRCVQYSRIRYSGGH